MKKASLTNGLASKFGDNMMKVISGVAMVLGVILALGLFIVIPMLAVFFLDKLVPLGGWKTVIEGVLKIAIFVAYLALCSRVKDVHRVFMYHGSEHKSIACYEAGDELTVENVRKIHPFSPALRHQLYFDCTGGQHSGHIGGHLG